MSTTTFKFHMPITISKAGEGVGEMIVGGIASTNKQDTDGEFLDPAGFDLTYLMKQGFVNWHHGKGPLDIIGEPIDAQIKPEGLFLKCRLYEDSDKAREVYQLAKLLQNQGRRLAFSIEGKATERNPNNPNYVSKAMITGVAITPMPKNSDTFMDILKGLRVHSENDGLDTTIDYEYECSDPGKNGGVVYIIDIIDDETGDRIQVTEDFEIIITKSLTSQTGSALRREHLDGDEKDVTITKGMTQIKTETQQALDRLRQRRLANKTQTLSKAMDPSNDGDGDDDDDCDDDEDNDAPMMKKRAIRPAMSNIGEMDELKKAITVLTDAVATSIDKLDDITKRLRRQENLNSNATSNIGDIQKGLLDEFESKTASIGVVMGGQLEKISQVQQTLERLEKGMSQVQEDLEAFGAQPMPTKTIQTRSAIERFEKGMDTSKVISMSRDRARVIELLNAKSGINSGDPAKYNKTYGNAVMSFEASGVLAKAIQDDLEASTGYTFIQ